jgi:hypothetical protein
MSVDYLLHESALGYAIFKVVNQADTIGNRLKEVQEAVQDLAKFGKVEHNHPIFLGRPRLTLLDRRTRRLDPVPRNSGCIAGDQRC